MLKIRFTWLLFVLGKVSFNKDFLSVSKPMSSGAYGVVHSVDINPLFTDILPNKSVKWLL